METNIKKEKRKKGRRNGFCVIKFIEAPPTLSEDDYICVPNTWVNPTYLRFDKHISLRPIVACPACKDVSEFKDLAKKRKKIDIDSWRLYVSDIKYETDSYANAELWIERIKRCGSIEKKSPEERDTQQEPMLDIKLRSPVSNCLSNPKTQKRYKKSRKLLQRMIFKMETEIKRQLLYCPRSSNISKSTFKSQENMKSRCSNKEQLIVTENPQPSCSFQIEKTSAVSNVEKSKQSRCLAENNSIADQESSNIQDSTKNTSSTSNIPEQSTSAVYTYDSFQMPNDQYKEISSYVQKTDINNDGVIIKNPQLIYSPQSKITASASSVEKSIQFQCIVENKSIARPESSNILETASCKLQAANRSQPVRQFFEKELTTVLKEDGPMIFRDRKLQSTRILKNNSYLSETPSTSKMPTQTSSALRYDSLQKLYMQEISKEQYKETNNYGQKIDFINDVMITSTAAPKPSISADELSQLNQHPNFKVSGRVSSHVPQDKHSDSSTKINLDGKRSYFDGIAHMKPFISLNFSDSVKPKSQQQWSEKTTSSVIENTVNKKPYDHIIRPSYITTASNSSYSSNSLPRHSVDRPASQISRSDVQETPRELQIQSEHYFGGIDINQDPLNILQYQRMPESSGFTSFNLPNSVNPRFQQWNENTTSSVIENPVIKKPYNQFIYPSYISSAANSSYRSHSSPRHSVDRPGSPIPQSYLQETPRQLQIQSEHYVGGIGINQDSLNILQYQRMPESSGLTSFDFLDSVNSRSQQSSENTTSSAIENPVIRKPYNQFIRPNYMTTTSNSSYRSNSLPRHSVDRLASQIPQSYLQETPRELQMQGKHCFGGIGINQDPLNIIQYQKMPEIRDLNRINHITPQFNPNNTSAAQNLSNLAQQARSFKQQPARRHIEIKANENQSIGQANTYDIQNPKIKTYALQNQIDRAQQSIQFFLSHDAEDRPYPQTMRSSLDPVQDLSNRHQDPKEDPRMTKIYFKSSTIHRPVTGRVIKPAVAPVLSKHPNSLEKAFLNAYRNSLIDDSHTHMQENTSERYVNQKSMNSAEPTLVTPNYKVLPTYSTYQLIKEKNIPDHAYQNPRSKKIMVDVSTETNFNSKHVCFEGDRVRSSGVENSPIGMDNMCQTDDRLEENSLSPSQEDISDNETNTNELINDSHIEESIPTVSDSVSGPRVVLDSNITSKVRHRTVIEQEMLDTIAILFGQMSNNLTIVCDMFMHSRSSMIELSKTYEKLLEAVGTYNATALNPI